MAVRIRMKRMGRKHRPFYRICAIDGHAPRDGRVIEELGHYDPMISETDARVSLQGERVAYWLGVGAQPSEKVAVLIKKYGENGTHLEEQKAANARLQASKPVAPAPVKVPEPEPETPPEPEGEAAPEGETAEAPAAEAAAEPEAPAEGGETEKPAEGGE